MSGEAWRRPVVLKPWKGGRRMGAILMGSAFGAKVAIAAREQGFGGGIPSNNANVARSPPDARRPP